ncbi:SdrD B-like domain-containing protein [Actinokineospora cianjurensis]|uniref:SdrD B-like domain-containing protein n=1 Tax=Actinokineospora cianjurensis TaxID=585224 RepID=UPI001477859C|nr:SdrD B-like domain-containing protein [Actinokineospora cianjurensis]
MRRAVSRIGVVVAAFALTGSLAVPSALAQDNTEPTPAATEQPSEPPAEPSPTETAPAETPPVPPTTPPAEPVQTTPEQPVQTTPPVEPTRPTETAPPAPAETAPAVPVPGARPVQPAAEVGAKAAAAAQADVSVSVSFDKASYAPAETVAITVKLTNKSSVVANGVRVDYSGKLAVSNTWGGFLNPWGQGMAPGSTRTLQLTGRIRDVENGEVDLKVTAIVPEGDTDTADNTGTASAAVEVTPTARFGGTAFEDRNLNGRPDAGEQAPGVKVTAKRADGSTVERTAGADGRFDFGDLPSGSYSVTYTPNHHQFRVQGVTGAATETLFLSGTAFADIAVRTWLDMFATVHASLLFDKPSYRPGDQVKATVVLYNRYPNDLTGVTLKCHPQGLGTSSAWGDLVDGGPGVTLPGLRSVTYTISDVVPADAADVGYVVADCTLNSTQLPGLAELTAEARVDGVLGTGAGRLQINGVFGPEPMRFATTRLRDRVTGAIVATATSTEAGEIDFSGIPVDTYSLLIDGPYRVDGLLVAPFAFPITAKPSGRVFIPVIIDFGDYPDLRVSAHLDKAEYVTSDVVEATVTIRNIGDGPATGVWFNRDQSTGSQLRVFDTGGLPSADQGITLAPGETREFVLHGATPAAGGTVLFGGSVVTDSAELDASNNSVQVSATSVAVTGDYTGVVYVDRDGDGVFDQGEGLPGVMLTASSYGGGWVMDRQTDADGRFAFLDIPGTVYSVHYGLEDADYTIPGGSGTGRDLVSVPSAGHDATVRAYLLLDRSLDASVSFDRDRYHPGDTATFTFSFSNKGTKRLTGVGVRGMHAEGDFQAQPSWDPIGPGGPGLTLEPGQRKTVTVTGQIPWGAKVRAMIGVAVVADGSSPSHGYVFVTDTAEVVPVPGQPITAANTGTTGTGQPVAQGGLTPRGTSGSGGSGGLADTGASVVGLGWFGFVALILGAGALMGARRRKTA